MKVNENDKVFFPDPKETVFFAGERTLFVDVDETLVFMKFDEGKSITSDLLKMSEFGFDKTLLPHWEHVNKIKEFRVRGIDVFVWSAGGRKWAQAVVMALGLNGIVNGVMGKPDWYIDDKDVNQWIGERFFLDIYSGDSVSLEPKNKE